jgi:hypothetical protein
MRKAFDDALLARLRRMPAKMVLQQLAIHLKSDPTYLPHKNPASRRWHVLTDRGDFEILTTGCKWLDTESAAVAPARSTLRCASWVCHSSRPSRGWPRPPGNEALWRIGSITGVAVMRV